MVGLFLRERFSIVRILSVPYLFRHGLRDCYPLCCIVYFVIAYLCGVDVVKHSCSGYVPCPFHRF